MTKSIERFVKLVCPDLSHDELEWAKRWASGPLSVKSVRKISMNVILSQILNLDVQADIQRLERRTDNATDIVRFLFLMQGRGAVENRSSPCTSDPVVSLDTLDAALFPPELLLADREIDLEVRFGALSQGEIVQDLVYVMQGIDGKHFKFSSSELSVPVRFKLPLHAQAAVKQVGGTGLMYRGIVALLSQERSNVLLTSFKVAVTEQLKDFLSLPALVDGNVPNWSLLKLVAWLTVPARKLKFIHSCVDEVYSSPPSEILNILSSRKQRRVFQASSGFFFDHVVRVWLAMVELWVCKGETSSPQFFIQRAPLDDQRPRFSHQPSPSLPDSSFVWRSQFEMHADLVPDFLSHALRDSIMLIGKGSAFIRICCTDHVEIIDETNQRFKSVHTLEHDLLSVGDSGNLRVVSLLLNHYHLEEHLTNIQKCLLLSQGDFADVLMTLAENELSKPAKEQNKYTLGSILDTAVRNSATDFSSKQDLSNRLHVSLGSPVDVTDTGFEVFELSYSVSPPLDVILDSDALRSYRKCFSYIWNIVRCDRALSRSWKDLQILSRQVSSLPAFFSLSAVTELIHKANVVRTDMAWFMRELRTMVSYDVIESHWKLFQARLPRVVNVEQLIALHEEFLRHIQEGLFLTPSDDDLLAETLCIMGTIVRFTESLPAIISELRTAILEREDVTEFRRKNINSLLEDLHDRSNDSFSGLFELVEDRRQHEERCEFFDRLGERLEKRSESLDRI